MTNRQFEHLGRALVAEAKLEQASSALDDLRNELAAQLSAFVDAKIASEFVRTHYGDNYAMFHAPSNFMDAVRQIVAENEKREGAE